MVSDTPQPRRREQDLLHLVVLVVAIILLVPLLMMVFMMPMMGMMGWWWSDGMMGGMSPLWGLGMTLVWLLVFVGIGYLFYRWVAGVGKPSAESDRALEELRLAYAKGELSDEEFEQRRDRLEREKD